MSKTISFVASDELAEFLEDEAERRMTTISSTAQMLLAERVREMMSGEAEADAVGDADGMGGVFDRHPDKWYRPDGKHEYAVRQPDGPTKYYKTEHGAAERLRRVYE
jgi:L-lysine 2,3-aminomutase